VVKVGNEVGLKNTLMVNLTNFGDFSVDINVYAFSKTVDWEEWRIAKEEVLKEIWRIIKRNGLEFAYPTQTVFLEKESNEI